VGIVELDHEELGVGVLDDALRLHDLLSAPVGPEFDPFAHT
jgi:hypothetical protein